ADGAFELSTNQKFSVLQGMTVGGGTEVNNAICFDTPAKVLDHWVKDKKIDINLTYYQDILRYVNSLIGKQSDPTPGNQFTNPGGEAFFKGLQQMGYPKPGVSMGFIAANIQNCIGCGMCITGCTYGSKQSMSERILPNLKSQYGDRLEIIERMEVDKLVAKGNSIYSLKCKDETGKTYEVKGKKFVVSAGAISSSALLHRSALNIPNVGKHLSFNITTPLTSFFDQPLYAYNGLPMAHYVEDPNLPFISETWFASPMMYALSMPGWFENHYNNMLDYNKLATAGVLVGTDNRSFVTKAGLVNFQPTSADLKSLYQGLEFTAKVFLSAGASKVVPNTFTYKEFSTLDQISNGSFVDHISQKDELAMMSAHPQGGNVMSSSPKEGTVDPTGKIWNYSNVFIADGSVFPSSVGVNPQVSIMAMSKYIAQHV
ncbi:MAG: GMC family oxidoreductase N-terminal domain-containing protein, partial [Cytophagales bacterium]|nr:GMC family oxidoreductase N-terminal domain-containing protein [Cytophagales bacterium]